jgi:hypothetical protein
MAKWQLNITPDVIATIGSMAKAGQHLMSSCKPHLTTTVDQIIPIEYYQGVVHHRLVIHMEVASHKILFMTAAEFAVVAVRFGWPPLPPAPPAPPHLLQPPTDPTTNGDPPKS